MNKKRIYWLDLMRGIAIIAVVVCHQQGLLHTSEYVQFATLFSVTSLIFLMGITKAYSLQKFYHSAEKQSLLGYTIKSVVPVLSEYILATYITAIVLFDVYDHFEILNYIVSFNISGPFYFIEHFLRLSLWAPVLYYFAVSTVSSQKHRMLKCSLALVAAWLVGYYSIGICDIFSQSYCFIYLAGMICALCNLPKPSKKCFLCSLILLLFGIYSAGKFYFARVNGNFAYAEFIDIINPKLQMNPPNLSVIIYSFGVIGIVYNIAGLVEMDTMRFVRPLFDLISILGKYSLDIFLWHMFIQSLLNIYALPYLDNIWLRRCVYYLCMLGLPILGKCAWNFFKKKVYEGSKENPNLK